MNRSVIAVWTMVALLACLFLLLPWNQGQRTRSPVSTDRVPKPTGPIGLITLDRNEASPGEELFANLTIQAIGKAYQLNTDPQIRIFRAGTAYGQPPLTTINLEGIGHSTIGEGSSLVTRRSIHAPDLPGYYRVEFTANPEQIGGGSQDLFVRYPDGALHIGSIELDASAEGFGRTLHVDRLVMTDKTVTVQFSLTPGVRAFNAELITDDGKRLLQRGGVPFDWHTITQAQTTYEPIPLNIHKLRFRLSHIQLFLPSEGTVNRPGEWEVEIPLPAR